MLTIFWGLSPWSFLEEHFLVQVCRITFPFDNKKLDQSTMQSFYFYLSNNLAFGKWERKLEIVFARLSIKSNLVQSLTI